jgi:hypothetical protein
VNVRLSSEQQRAKQFSPIDSTETGMEIDFSDEQSENERLWILCRCESDSNETTERRLHPAKHRSPRISTEAGMQMHLSDLQNENAPTSIRRN